jgi:hypothetical protein
MSLGISTGAIGSIIVSLLTVEGEKVLFLLLLK